VPPPFFPPEGRHAPEGRERAREAVPLEAEVAQRRKRGERRRERPRQADVLEVEVVDAALLPQLGSAWACHDTILAGPVGTVLILTELAALSYTPSGSAKWMKHPLYLSSKPRSPILASDAVFALCDVDTPWCSQWKLFSCPLAMLTGGWVPVERTAWGDVFEVLKRPRLLAGASGRRVLMIGGLRSSFAMDAPCSTVLILRLDLATMEWEEAGRMPPNMYRCFTGLCEAASQGGAIPAAAAEGNNKDKVFRGDGKVWFTGKRVRVKLAMWEEDEMGSSGKWDWVDGLPGYGDVESLF
jgi:hypothetical protein